MYHKEDNIRNFFDSIIRGVFDKEDAFVRDQNFNKETEKCVSSVINFVFKENKPLDNRPTFYTKSKLPIRAAGIICYVFDKKKNKKIWLFRKSKGYLTDTGGKTDSVDKNAMDTAIRETVEETNGHLFSSYHSEQKCSNILTKILPKQRNIIYNKGSKYLLFLMELNYSNIYKPMNRFGKIEREDNEPHSYQWYEKIPDDFKLHPRLQNIKHIFN